MIGIISNKMDKLKLISQSDSGFYKKVLNKYQLGKKNCFRLPSMIFLKNKGIALPQKIAMNMSLRLHLYDHNKFGVLNTAIKNFHNMSRLFSWFSEEKYLSNSEFKSLVVDNVLKVSNKFVLGKKVVQSKVFSSISAFARRPFVLKHLFQKEFIDTLSINQRQNINYNFSAQQVKNKFMKHLDLSIYKSKEKITRNSLKSMNYFLKNLSRISEYTSLINREGTGIIAHNTYVGKSQEMINQSKVFLDIINGNYFSNRFNVNEGFTKNYYNKYHKFVQHNAIDKKTPCRPFQLDMTINKPSIKQYHHRYRSDTVYLFPPLNRSHSEIENKEFIYNKQRKITQEFDEVKKVVAKTKYEVREKFDAINSELNKKSKQDIDIHGISDRVYQNIERKIRMERERIGL